MMNKKVEEGKIHEKREDMTSTIQQLGYKKKASMKEG